MALACTLGRDRLEQGRERAARELPARGRAAVLDQARDLAERLPTLWRRRDRPGGLADTLHWWSRIERALSDG
jgi:hypothetical protein